MSARVSRAHSKQDRSTGELCGKYHTDTLVRHEFSHTHTHTHTHTHAAAASSHAVGSSLKWNDLRRVKARKACLLRLCPLPESFMPVHARYGSR